MDVASSRSAAGSCSCSLANEGANVWRNAIAKDSGNGCRQNQPAMERVRGARLPLATGICLKATEARWDCCVMLRGSWYMCQQKDSIGASPRKETVCPDCPMTNILPELPSQGAGRIIHHLRWQHHRFQHGMVSRFLWITREARSSPCQSWVDCTTITAEALDH